MEFEFISLSLSRCSFDVPPGFLHLLLEQYKDKRGESKEEHPCTNAYSGFFGYAIQKLSVITVFIVRRLSKFVCVSLEYNSMAVRWERMPLWDLHPLMYTQR